MDAVIHAMAVSDFSFQSSKSKLKSDKPADFIKYMSENLIVNPKIISSFRGWAPKAQLVGFKFEVGQSTKDLIDIADDLRQRNNLDMVVANDKSEMIRENEHIGYIVKSSTDYEKCYGKNDIADKLFYSVLDNQR